MADGVEPSRNGTSRGMAQNGSHARGGTGHAGRSTNSGNTTGHPHLNPNLSNAHNGLMSGGPEGSLSMMSNAPPASGFGPATPAGVSMAYSSHPHPTTQPPPPPDYGSSWRNPLAAALAGSGGGAGGSTGGQPQPGMAATAEAFSNYYFSGGYSPFSGDIRDSIAAIWSRTSPSGEGVAAAYSSGYGPFPDTSTGQFAANATPTGQFAANLTGHYAPGSEMGMFGTGPDYPPAAYGQPQFNYGQQYSQWPESAGVPNSSASGAIGSGNNGGMGVRNGMTNPGSSSSYGIGYGGEGASRETSMRHSRERGPDLSHGMGTLKLTNASRRGTDMNGHSEAGTSHSKKMSWASVASQPAKPQSIAPKTKKPGVLPPPTLIPSASKTLPVEVSNSSLPRDPSPPLDNMSVEPLIEPEMDRPESLPSTKRESRQPNPPLHLQQQPNHLPQARYQPRNQQQFQPSQQQQQQQQQPHQLLSHHQHHHQTQHYQPQQQQQLAHPPHDPPGHRSGHQGRNTGSHSPSMRKSLGHNGDGGRMGERHPNSHSSSRDMHDTPRGGGGGGGGGYADKSGSNSGPRNQRQYSNANGSSGSSHEHRSGNGRSGHHGDFNSGEKKRTDRMADFGGGGGAAPASGSHGGPPSVQATHHPILESLQSQNEYNPKTFDLNPKNAKFFVIKSFSEDDIHRSIKYEIWCSTDHGNKRLDAGFKERNGKGPVFLLFSVNGSGHFCGMAEMLSGVDYNATGSVWVQDKFKGQFKVKWIYVKDVPNGQLRHIRLENNENKPVTNSRDTQEVPPDKGRQVLKIIHMYKHQTSIFDDFIHYEKRQEEEEGKKSMSAAPSSGHSTHNKDASNGGNHQSLQHPPRGGGGGGGAGKDGADTHQGGRGGRGGDRERAGKFNHHPNNHFNSNTKNTNNMGSKTPNTSGQGASNRR